MAKLNLYKAHEQKVKAPTQLTHTQNKGVAMTKCSTRIVDYTTKYADCLRRNLVR